MTLSAATMAIIAEEAALEELDQVTVTATRSSARVTDVPASVTGISAARMDRQLAENIEDLVRYEPGATARTAPARFTAALATTGRDGQSGFNIRGLEGNRVLIQVDGVRTPDAYSFGAQSVGRGEYVDLGLLKSVEIVRGPASALYGSDGLAGTVTGKPSTPTRVGMAHVWGNYETCTTRSGQSGLTLSQ
jgi:hemoglobin/transferrin/lactoferrin receptor protein